MAGVTGLEPATFGVTGRRSNQTELHPHNKNVYIDIWLALQDFFLIIDIFLYQPRKSQKSRVIQSHNIRRNTRQIRRKTPLGLKSDSE